MCYIDQVLLHHIELRLLVLVPDLHDLKIADHVGESVLQLLVLHHPFSYQHVHIDHLLF